MQKNQVHCYSKREETRHFSGPYFRPDFFSGSQNDLSFQNKNSGCRLNGRLSAFRNCSMFSNFFGLISSMTTDSWGFTRIKHAVLLVCSESGVQILPGELFRLSFKLSECLKIYWILFQILLHTTVSWVVEDSKQHSVMLSVLIRLSKYIQPSLY